MTVVHLEEGQVSAQVSVAISRAPTGRELRDGYLNEIQELTFGLVRARGSTFYFGPLELMRFGTPAVNGSSVEWPIVGGVTTRKPGGSFRLEATGGRLFASVDGYLPRLPLPLYALTQLPVHQLLTRLYLLRFLGREPAPGIRAASHDRMRAAAVDIAFGLTHAGLAVRRRWLLAVLAYATAN